jgi:DNA-binding MarR family transcriptional regulator
MGARELSGHLHLDPGTLSPLVKRLEGAGLVAKTKNPADERAVVIQPTPKGQELRSKAMTVPREMMERLALSENDVLELRSILDRMIASGANAPKE